MLTILEQTNYFFVLLFGVIISAAFSGITNNQKNRKAVLVITLLLTLVQAFFYYVFHLERTRELYPLITHLPLAAILVLYFKKNPLVSIVSVLSAYLCCQARRWFGTIFLFFFGNMTVNYIAQIVVTIPFIVILLRYIVPPMVRLMLSSRRSLLLFGALPFIYYLFDYITTVYTDILYNGTLFAVEFIPSTMAICFYTFAVIHSNEMQRRRETENERQILAIQAKQGLKELDAMRRSQKQIAIYQHDLRHHLHYVDSCIQTGKLEEAHAYIQSAYSEIERSDVIRYCENETVNLILSSFAAKAKKAGIRLTLAADIAEDIGISSTDLCVILANGLENALNACKKVDGDRYIALLTRRENSTTFLQIQNPYTGHIPFVNGLPITSEENHGYGIKSIVMTIDKLGGLCDFIANNGVFTLRASM